jgi:D-3-phosphoglycerate dehydrogenase
MAGRHQDLLHEAGFEVIHSPYDRPARAHEMADLLADVDGAILGVDEVRAESLARAERLKVLSRFGIGVDALDLAALQARGIVVTNTPGANSLAVAELTFALMMALARNLVAQQGAVKAGSWSPQTGVELAGSTLGLLGLGRIGREVAERAAAFGMKVLFYDPFPPPEAYLAKWGFRLLPLEAVLSASDFLSLHLPLTPETQNLLSAERLALLKQGAYVVNTARGGLLDEAALYAALKDGRLAGAACDAFAEEPPRHNPLLTLDNFIATPHAGSATRQTTLKMGVLAAENLIAVLRGEAPAHRVV